jgi:hypothetical protein
VALGGIDGQPALAAQGLTSGDTARLDVRESQLDNVQGGRRRARTVGQTKSHYAGSMP